MRFKVTIVIISALLWTAIAAGQTMQQLAADNFNRADAPTLGPSWTPLSGTNNNVPFQIVNHQIQSTASSCCSKEMYYGGINWPADQYSQVQIASYLEGSMGPAVRMSSNDTHYACIVDTLGSGNASLEIIKDIANSYTTLASSNTATVTQGDVIRCTVQGTTLTMTDQTTSTSLLTATDNSIPGGYPGVIVADAGMPVTYNVMANWSGGASTTPVSTQVLATDSFSRTDSIGLGSQWDIGTGHGPIQIVSGQIEPFPSGGPQPSKEHYVGYGPFPNDQWSQAQIVTEDQLGDNAAEVRASDNADTMYVCDVNTTGPAGTAQTRIVKVINGVITTIVIDQRWSSVSPGDYIRGQVHGNVISLIDVTTGVLLLSAVDTSISSGYPGWSMQMLSGTESDHIAGTWSAGGFNTATLVSLSVTPANGSVARGRTQQFTATGTYSDGSTQDLSSSVTWSSSNATVATISSAGLASTVGTGSTSIQASSGSVTGSTTLTVTAPVLVSLAVTPASSSIVVGSNQAYTATGTYSDGSTSNLTSSVTWSSTNMAVATISAAGVASAVAKGSTTIQATSGSISGSASLTVTTALVSIAVTPANPTIALGLTQQFTATGTYSDGSTVNLTTSVTWSSSNTGVATITGTGLTTGVGVGSTTIQASSGSISGSTGLGVTAAVLVSVAITPANSSIVQGMTQQFTATGTYSDGSTVNLTSSVSWASTVTTVATISSTGLATSVGVGTTTVQATSGSITASTNLKVTSTISGLTGYWTFDEGSGTTAADSSGNGHTANLVNGVSWGTGKIGNAITTNGVNQYGSIPAIDLSGTSAVTVTMWVKRTYSTAGGHALMEATTNFNSSSTGFGLFPDDSSCNGIMAGVHGNVGYTINCYAQPSSGVWHHLAAVYDKSQTGSNEVKLYIDGALQTPTRNYLTSNNTNNFGNNPIYLFSRGGTQEFNAGSMDDLRLYNRALSATEIQQVYSGAGSSPLTISVNPATLTGGGTSTGTVLLGSAAPSGGATVTLTSSNTSVATVPASVTVPGGSTATTFTVTTKTVASSTAVTIAGTYGSANSSATLTVTPPITAGLVQFSSGDSGSSATETSYLDHVPATGNLIIAFSHWDNQALTATVTDNLGNTYVPITGPVNVAPTSRFQAWYAKNITGGAPLGVTITYSGKTSSISLVDVAEYSGLDTSSPLDVVASAIGNGTFEDSGPSPMTSVSSETIVGLFGYAGYAAPFTAGTGFTVRGYDASSMLEDQGVASQASYHATASSNGSTNWAAFVIGFKNAN